jgi:hypothetical protein
VSKARLAPPWCALLPLLMPLYPTHLWLMSETELASLRSTLLMPAKSP